MIEAAAEGCASGVQLAKEHIAMLRDEVAQVFTMYDYDKSGE